MGNLKRIFAGALIFALAPLTGVQAGGDFRFPPEPVVAVPSAIPIAEYPSWYLRGDIGWGFAESFDLNQNGAAISNPDADDIFSIGAGFGYYFSDNVRGDVTAEHRFDTDVTGTNVTTGTLFTTELSSTVLLGNVYYDFRGRDEFSPYLGAGLGVAFNDTNTDDSQRTELAASVMAGVTYRMRDNVSLDAGYRMLYLGEARMDTAVPTALEDIIEHEIRVGVRYEFE